MSNLEAASRESPLREWPLALAVVTLTAALLGKGWIAGALNQPVMLIALLAGLCGVILAAAVAIVRHADVLANRLGEPAGTPDARCQMPPPRSNAAGIPRTIPSSERTSVGQVALRRQASGNTR